MNKTIMQLELLIEQAKKEPELRKSLLDSKFAKDPTDVFCTLAQEAGYDITVGEIFQIGQEYSDNLCKSTNGGNPRPTESFEDILETYLASL